MHLLHKVLEEDSGLREVVYGLSERIATNPLKHALVLDLNPFWLGAYRVEAAGLREEFLFRALFDTPFLPIVPPWNGGVPDLSRTFHSADQLTDHFFGKVAPQAQTPFMLRIFASRIDRADRDLFEQRRKLEQEARESRIPTIVETQEPARLVTAPGDRVFSSSGTKGTVGGFLKDGLSGKTYAATCGHVVSSGAATTSVGPLGKTVHSASPASLPAGVSCSASCGYITELDLALIDVGGSSVSNVATSIAHTVCPGDIVEMHGASSGTICYEIGGAVVDHAVASTCWTRLHQFHAPITSGIVPVAFRVATTPLPKDGDSGAWLIRGRTEWAGMVVASNALLGFALAATHILSKGDSSFGTKLALA